MSLVYRKLSFVWNGWIHCGLDMDSCREPIVLNSELNSYERIDPDKFFGRQFEKNLLFFLLPLHPMDVFFCLVVRLSFSVMIDLKKHIWLIKKIQSIIPTLRWICRSTLGGYLTELFNQWEIFLSVKTECMAMVFLNQSFLFDALEKILLPK